jgi:hypothetical protein
MLLRKPGKRNMESNSGYSTILSTRVQKEILKAWDWYEDRQQGLGDLFVEDALKCIRKIEQAPARYKTRFKTYKETSLATFPFLVIYRINERKKLLRIVSLFHTSISPKKKY